MGPTVNRQCRGTVLGSFFILNKKPWNWVSFILSSSVRTLFCLFFFCFSIGFAQSLNLNAFEDADREKNEIQKRPPYFITYSSLGP